MKELVGAAAADILQALNFGGAGTIIASGNLALKKLMQKRASEAREIVWEEMRRGERHKLQVLRPDEFVAMAYRYSRAAQEGAARLNLRLMARVMSGQLVEPSLFASDFLAYADLISSLRREEIVYLGTMLKWTKQGLQLPKKDVYGPGGRPEQYGVAQSVAIKLKQELPETLHFADGVAVDICALALQRTGLLHKAMSLSDGTDIFEPSPLLMELADMADFEQALESEGVKLPE